MGNKSKKKINSKNKTKKKIKGGRGPLAINTTGYYTKNASNEPDKLIEIIVSNNMDPDRYFDTYGIYPYDNPPSFWEDMTELINFDRDNIDKMKYRLTPFIKPGVNQGIIKKSRIAVVNDEETVNKIKVARNLIAYLNTPAGSALINALMNGSPVPVSSGSSVSSDMSSLTGSFTPGSSTSGSSTMQPLTRSLSDMSSLTGSLQTAGSRKRKPKKSIRKKTHKRNKKYYGGAGPKDYKDIFSISRNREDIINGANITDPEEIDIAHELLKSKAFFNTIMKLTGKIRDYEKYEDIDGEQLFNPSQPIVNKIKKIVSSREKQVENMNYSQFKDEFENDKDLTSPQIAKINELLTDKYVEGEQIVIDGSKITISYIDSDNTRLNYAKKAYLLYHKLDTSDIDMVINEEEIRMIDTSKILKERVNRDVVLSELEKKQIIDILDEKEKADDDSEDNDSEDNDSEDNDSEDNRSEDNRSEDNRSVNSFDNRSVNSFDNRSVNSFDNSSVNSFDNSSSTSFDNSSVNNSGNSSSNGSQMIGGAGSEISSFTDENEYPENNNTEVVVNSQDNKNLDKAKDFYIQKLKEHGKYKKTVDDRFSGAKKTVIGTFSSEESLINKMSKEELQTKMANDKRLEDANVWNPIEINSNQLSKQMIDNSNIGDKKTAYIKALNKYKKIKELQNITEISKINELLVEDFKLKIEKDNELNDKNEILGLINDERPTDYNLAKAKLKYIKIKNSDRKTAGEKIINSINNETLLSEEIDGDTDLDKPGDRAVLQNIMSGNSDDKISTAKREYIRMLKASGKIDKTIGDKTSEKVDMIGQEARKFGTATAKGVSAVGTATVAGARAVGTATAERAHRIGEATVAGARAIGTATTNRLDSTRQAANRTIANVRQRFNRGGAKNRTRRIKPPI